MSKCDWSWDNHSAIYKQMIAKEMVEGSTPLHSHDYILVEGNPNVNELPIWHEGMKKELNIMSYDDKKSANKKVDCLNVVFKHAGGVNKFFLDPERDSVTVNSDTGALVVEYMSKNMTCVFNKEEWVSFVIQRDVDYSEEKEDETI